MVPEVTENECEKTIRYFDRSGDPCRLQCGRYGKLTADYYVAGEGHVEIDPVELPRRSYEISQERYKAMVVEIVSLHHRREAAAS